MKLGTKASICAVEITLIHIIAVIVLITILI
jgi:hypothetical protein